MRFAVLSGIALVASVANTQPTTTEACASVSILLASYASASPSATAALRLPAELAYECSNSAPIIKEDALNLVDGLTAFLEWESTLAYLKDPPEGYLLAGVDLIGGMQQIGDQISSGAISSELDFQTKIMNLIGQAHSGHLLFVGDALSVFGYERTIGSLVSVSNEDGTLLPSIYAYSDVLAVASKLNNGWDASAITMINGQNAVEFLKVLALNGTVAFQDPDAMYNAVFGSLVNANDVFSAGTNAQVYIGPSTSVVFANGTSQTYPNIAATRKDFTGIASGADFYNAFCNFTAKIEALEPESPAVTTAAATSVLPTQTPVQTALPGFPSPIVLSADGSVAGYFFDDAMFQKLAVLRVSAESETEQQSAQAAVTQFLDACRKNSMEFLVIDVQSNPGGEILVGYDIFKQLFPSLEPYGAGNMRAQPQLDVLGSFITPVADAAIQEEPHNLTNFEDVAGGYSDFDASTWLDESGQNYGSWSALYGPRTVHGDNFTNVVRRNISDPNDDLESGLIVSGYGNRSNLAPQPFKSENIVLLTDGLCSSTCTILSHYLKWQAKVKSIAMGGRPETGPMQYIGGVKGSQVLGLETLSLYIDAFYEQADENSIKAANATALKTLYELGEYIQGRSAALTGAEASEVVSFNLENSIAEGDASTTPLHFVYEAADCRLWFQAEDLVNITNLWTRVAANAFGLNGIEVFSKCMRDSTNAPSSLSGNSTLFAGGKADNVTSFESDQLPSGTSGGSSSSSTSSSGSSVTNAASRNGVLGGFGMVGAAVVVGGYALL